MEIFKFTKVPNNADGQAFIRVLRSQINEQGKQLRVRARGHRHGRTDYQRELPHCLAKTFTVYIEPRRIR